jgi:hypothetical protein
MLTLERIGLDRPALYRAAAEHARRLSALDEDKRAPGITAFQGALALVERARWSRAIDRTLAGDLVAKLVALDVSERDLYRGELIRWVETALLPAFEAAVGTGPEANPDLVVLSAIAGINPAASADGNPDSAAIVEWEGNRYRLDVAHPELMRLQRVRARQGGNTLEDVLAFCQAAADVEKSSEVRSTQGLASLRSRAEHLTEVRFPGGTRANPKALAERAADLLGRRSFSARSGRQLGAAARDAGELLLADIFRSLVYAAALGDPEGPALLGSSVASRHEPAGAASAHGQAVAGWQLPQEDTPPGGTWHVTGSLLGLDVGLSRLALRRLGPPVLMQPTLTEDDRRAFAQTVSLMNPMETTGERRSALLDALKEGRRRVAGLTPGDVEAVARDAGIGDWRRRALDWIVAREPENASNLFSAAELVWLGRTGDSSGPDLDAFGTATLGLGGSLHLRFPAPAPWENFAGQGTGGLRGARMADLTIALAERLAELGVPAPATRDVLRAVMQDFIDEVHPADTDDLWSLIEYARRLDSDRLQDYVAALAAGGPFVSLESGGRD